MLQYMTYLLVYSAIGLVIADTLYMMYRNGQYYLNDDRRFGRDLDYIYLSRVNRYFGDVPTCLIMLSSVVFALFYGIASIVPRPPTSHTDNIIFWCNTLFTIPSVVYIVFSVVMKHARLITRLKKSGSL